VGQGVIDEGLTIPHQPYFTVILIDAVTNAIPTSLLRKGSSRYVTQWSLFPERKLKLIVTGRRRRGAPIIPRRLQTDYAPYGDNVDDDANKDIRHFFQEHFAERGGSSFRNGLENMFSMPLNQAGRQVYSYGPKR